MPNFTRLLNIPLKWVVWLTLYKCFILVCWQLITSTFHNIIISSIYTYCLSLYCHTNRDTSSALGCCLFGIVVYAACSLNVFDVCTNSKLSTYFCCSNTLKFFGILLVVSTVTKWINWVGSYLLRQRFVAFQWQDFDVEVSIRDPRTPNVWNNCNKSNIADR